MDESHINIPPNVLVSISVLLSRNQAHHHRDLNHLTSYRRHRSDVLRLCCLDRSDLLDPISTVTWDRQIMFGSREMYVYESGCIKRLEACQGEVLREDSEEDCVLTQ
jgi:hypothetical protein